MTRIIGIDLGKQGAVAVIDDYDMGVCVYDMPGTIEEKRVILSEIGSVKCAWIEKPFFPRMIGIKNAVTIATAYGELKACLFFAGIPTFEVTPAIWKRHFGLSTDKDASRALAGQHFPDQAHLWKLKKQDGRAESVLIALYGKGRM